MPIWLLHWCYRLAHETQYPTVTKYSPDAGQIAEMAERAGVKQPLTHIRKHMDTDNHHDEMIAAARTKFTGPCAIAEDLLVIDL